jgi:hypothetical protein
MVEWTRTRFELQGYFRKLVSRLEDSDQLRIDGLCMNVEPVLLFDIAVLDWKTLTSPKMTVLLHLLKKNQQFDLSLSQVAVIFLSLQGHELHRATGRLSLPPIFVQPETCPIGVWPTQSTCSLCPQSHGLPQNLLVEPKAKPLFLRL